MGNRSENNKEKDPGVTKPYNTPMSVREARHLQKQLDTLGGRKTRVKRFFDLLATGILVMGCTQTGRILRPLKRTYKS